MNVNLQTPDILSSSVQRQLTVFLKVLDVVGDDYIATACKSTLVLKHVFKIFTGIVNCCPKLIPVHWKCIDKSFKFVQSIIDFIPCVVMPYYISQIGKGQQRCINRYLAGIGGTKYQSCFKSTRTVVVKVNEYVSIQKDVFHFPIIYAKRSSLARSSLVICPIPRNCINSSGSSGRLFQSIAESLVFTLVVRLCVVVMRRRALMAFSIMPSSVTMTSNSRNNSAFNCSVVIT